MIVIIYHLIFVQVLTLVSNERIPLSDHMRMVFEIDSLKNATPATVSRAGGTWDSGTVGYLDNLNLFLLTFTFSL